MVRCARKLRREMSLPEVLIWQQLRKQPGRYRFRRQFPTGRDACDFACLSARLIIEIDGVHHNAGDQAQYDLLRDARLAEVGFATLRLPARDVLTDLEMCVNAVVSACAERGPPPPRLRRGPPPRAGEDFK